MQPHHSALRLKLEHKTWLTPPLRLNGSCSCCPLESYVTHRTNFVFFSSSTWGKNRFGGSCSLTEMPVFPYSYSIQNSGLSLREEPGCDTSGQLVIRKWKWKG